MNKDSRRRAVALGTFDGLHPGHRAVIHACVQLARQNNASALVYTFWENPKSLFGTRPVDITPAPVKLTRILELGADEVAADHFTPALSRLSPEQFIVLLSERFHPIAFVCGEDYSFGADGTGSSETLKHLAAQQGIETLIVPTVKVLTAQGYSDKKVSSTLIRTALQSGDTQTANKLLSGEAI